MALKEYVKKHGIEDEKRQGYFLLTLCEGANEPVVEKVPAINISSVSLDETAYFQEAFSVDNLPAAALRHGSRGMAILRVNPDLIKECTGKRSLSSMNFIEINDGATNSIILDSNPHGKYGNEGTIIGKTIHGDQFRATIGFVPRSR